MKNQRNRYKTRKTGKARIPYLGWDNCPINYVHIVFSQVWELAPSRQLRIELDFLSNLIAPAEEGDFGAAYKIFQELHDRALQKPKQSSRWYVIKTVKVDCMYLESSVTEHSDLVDLNLVWFLVDSFQKPKNSSSTSSIQCYYYLLRVSLGLVIDKFAVGTLSCAQLFLVDYDQQTVSRSTVSIHTSMKHRTGILPPSWRSYDPHGPPQQYVSRSMVALKNSGMGSETKLLSLFEDLSCSNMHVENNRHAPLCIPVSY